VLFDFGRPVFIDFAAIVPLERAWLDEQAGRFRDYWILPLTFIKMGHPHFARSLRKSCEVTEPLDELLKRRELSWFPLWYQRLRRKARAHPTEFFGKLKERLEGLRLPGEDESAARAAEIKVDEGDAEGSIRAFAQKDSRARTLSQVLDRVKPSTLLDIGCGDGLYSMLAESKGIKVVAIDEDERRVNSLYRRVRQQGLHILPLLLDFSIPTTGQGRKKDFPPSTERLACDASLMLSVLPRLFFELELGFERISNLLAAYSRKHAVIEFVPPRQEYAFKHKESRLALYGPDNFVKAMERHFRLSEIFETEGPRKLLLFEKR
jgi:Tellurite resistance protein TehB